MPTDLEIASKATLEPVSQIAKQLDIGSENLELYGQYKAKLPLSLIDE